MSSDEVVASTQRWAALLPYRDRLVRLARCKGAGMDAEDVAHEALLRTVSQPGLDLNRAWSYLAKVTANLVTDLHRRAVRDQTLRVHVGLSPRPQSADEEVDDAALAQHAARLVTHLAPELRDILVLRGNGATWSQVGARLGEHPTTAEMRYRRGVASLRRQLRPC